MSLDNPVAGQPHHDHAHDNAHGHGHSSEGAHGRPTV